MSEKILVLFLSLLLIGICISINETSINVDAEFDGTNLDVKLIVDHTSYKTNENINLTINITNFGNQNITLSFGSSQRADFQVTNDNNEVVYLWSYDRVFADMYSEITIHPQESLVIFNSTWDQKNITGSQVPAGNYTISGWTFDEQMKLNSNFVLIQIIEEAPQKPSNGTHIPHAPIRINGNIEFTREKGVVGGAGTDKEPFIIEGWEINGSGYRSCIYVGNTTSHFIIRNCLLHDAFIAKNTYFNGYGIKLENIQYGIIENNTIINNTDEGIYLNQSSNNNIRNNYCCNNGDGILLNLYCSFNEIINNNFSNNRNNGIGLESWSNSNKILNNICLNNSAGISIVGGDYNSIINNTCNYNQYDGFFIDMSNLNIFKNNICNNNGFAGIYSFESPTIITNNNFNSNNEMGIYFLCSDLSFISNNTCNSNLKNGIFFDYLCNSNSMINNTCNFNNGNGIDITDSDSNIIKKNYISNNKGFGIILRNDGFDPKNNIISENVISFNSGTGISIDLGCNYNLIFRNNILTNSQQAIDNGSNQWNNENNEGNYWSDYFGLDNGANGRVKSDGIGDTNLPHLGLDNYPLIGPINSLLLTIKDADVDGISDLWEKENNLNSSDPTDAVIDFDNDELTNLEEYLNTTDPYNPDTDDDGILDGQEINIYHTNPLKADTDGDGFYDGKEIEDGFDPLNEKDYPKYTPSNSNPNNYLIFQIVGLLILIILVLMAISFLMQWKNKDKT